MTKKTIVVKFGTSTLTQGTPKLNSPHMMEIVRQIAQLHHDGFRIVIVLRAQLRLADTI